MSDPKLYFSQAVDHVRRGQPVDKVARDLLSKLSMEERQKLLYGSPF